MLTSALSPGKARKELSSADESRQLSTCSCPVGSGRVPPAYGRDGRCPHGLCLPFWKLSVCPELPGGSGLRASFPPPTASVGSGVSQWLGLAASQSPFLWLLRTGLPTLLLDIRKRNKMSR